MAEKNRAPIYWAYATHRDAEGRWARGFILAVDRTEALHKARRRLVTERNRVAKAMNMTPRQLSPLGRGRATYRVRVWKDPDRSCAPRQARHYQEKERRAG